MSDPERQLADAVLHPDGRCTCAAEGVCVWCLTHCDGCGDTVPVVGLCLACMYDYRRDEEDAAP